MSSIRDQLAAKRAEARKNAGGGTPVRGQAQSGRTTVGSEGLEEERTVSGQIRKGVKSGNARPLPD